MKHLPLFLCLFLPALLAAQACDYNKLFQEGKAFAKQRQYKKALYKFNSARRCDPAKGETVDAAIEALLDQVEREKKAADKERVRAEEERKRAEQALEDLRKTSGKVVESLLRDAENETYHLRYAEALEKMNAAAGIGQKKPEVARALMEIAYFYAESGRFSEARDISATVAKLLGKDVGAIRIDTNDAPATRRTFRQTLKSLHPTRYAELEARYYPVMVDIKGGEFIPGCEKGINCDSLPHVKLSDFQIARTETTFWQFALYAAATEQKMRDFSPSWGLDGDNPVVKVSWYQSVEYANWLSVQHDLQPAYDINLNSTQINPSTSSYRLPTEAEWEYAAQGGVRQDTFLYSGSNDLAVVAWYYQNCDTLGVQRTRPVATRLPNGLGLHDMSGNVWEWCGDWWADYPSIFPANYRGPDSGGDRVLRGGGWGSNAESCRAAYRGSRSPTGRNISLGFRLARSF